MDFDDLLSAALELPGSNPRGFTHLLVDEFQDINGLQYSLVRKWSETGKSLFVIGDPDQSIYGFRGATGECFGRLRKEVPELRVIRLRENYRSTPQILSCAYPVLPDGNARPPLLPNRPDGSPVRFAAAESDFSEGIFIAKEIARMTGGVDMLESDRTAERSVYRSFSDIAILCRTHRQADLIEKCLVHDSIPCVVTGRENYLEDDTVRGVLAFFRFLLDQRDLPSLRSSLRCLWNCPADLADQAAAYFSGTRGTSPEDWKNEFRGLGALEFWAGEAESYLPLLKKERPRKLLEHWYHGKEPSPAMEKLLQASVFFSDLPTFLQNLLLGQEGDLRRTAVKSYDAGAVHLMTLHGSKGLEFPVVFLAGVKKGNIPFESERRLSDPDEERRLFFVGLTRAKDELILSGAPELSPLLKGLPLEFQKAGKLKPEPAAEQLSFF